MRKYEQRVDKYTMDVNSKITILQNVLTRTQPPRQRRQILIRPEPSNFYSTTDLVKQDQTI